MRYFFLLFFCFHSVSANTFCLKPWYTGSLFALSAVVVPKGQYAIQPYLNLIENYGVYDDNFHLISTDNQTQINAIFLFQGGITSFSDFQILGQTFSTFQQGESSTQIGDTNVLLGLQLLRENPCSYKPNIRLIFAETFPTGKYENLSEGKLGTDIGGEGSYDTTIGIVVSKQYYPSPRHPLQVRFNFLYTISSKFKAKNFHIYGGEKGSLDRVNPGNQIQFILAPEYSLNQSWVLTTDIMYTHINKTFVQRIAPDTHKDTRLTMPSEDCFSLAPAIEYNYNSNFGVLGGIWFSVIGRNTEAFVSPMFSLVYTF